MINKILFATDLGAYTSHCLLHVEHLAKQHNAVVDVVHAVPPIGDFAAAVLRSHCSEQVKAELLTAPYVDGIMDALREQMFELIAQEPFEESGLLAYIGNIVVRPGHPAAVILAEAERMNADLIVIGSHSAEALDGRLLGSVATRVLQLAKAPVFMVPMMNPADWIAARAGLSNPGFRA
jgi:nucleotide-binding universal stress UspA family protein